MPIEVDTLPQKVDPPQTVTIKEVIRLLPLILPWPLNVWIGGKLAKYGRTCEGIIFLVEMDGEPTVQQREGFNRLMEPLGIPATLYEGWKNARYEIIRLYNQGRLIIDKDTLCFKELPDPVYEAPILTVGELTKKLPREIPWKQALWLTGGIVKAGWTCNDVDFISNSIEKTELPKMVKFFSEAIGWKTDVGLEVMPEREPVYLFKTYENGLCQLP